MLTESEMNELRSGVHARATAALEKLTAYSDRARALLKRIEWSAPGGYESYNCCPECGGVDPDGGYTPKDVTKGHKPDCELAALIGAKP